MENISLAFGEHFSFLFLLSKPLATFPNRRKGQGQGAAETFCPTGTRAGKEHKELGARSP